MANEHYVRAIASFDSSKKNVDIWKCQPAYLYNLTIRILSKFSKSIAKASFHLNSTSSDTVCHIELR